MSCKKILACVTSLLICCGALATPQVADLVSSSILVHADDSGSCGENATYSFDSSTGTLTISGTGAIMNDFTDKKCRSYINDIKKIIIEYGITEIGDMAFLNCSNLVDIFLPNSVLYIGNGVFCNCSSLKEVTIPESVVSVNCNQGSSSFSVGSISNIFVDENNKYFTSVDGVLFSKDLTILVSYPAGKTETSYTIPNSVISIDSYAFEFCRYLQEINIPDNVNYIEDGAFRYCVSLKNIVIPSNVISIGDNAFQLSSLTEITIPDSVISIGSGAFSQCKSLKSIDIPNSVTSIGNAAFSHCTSLIEFVIPNKITSIGSSTFSNCTSLTKLTIPNSITSIGRSAFYSCKSLKDITIPNIVTSIEEYAFFDCTSLTDIYYSGTEEKWNNINISSNNAPLIDATIHYESMGSCGDNATWLFDDTTGTLTISGTGAMKDYLSTNMPWYDYKDLIKNIVIEDGITYIGDYSFSNCSVLTDTDISSSVISIGYGVFEFCISLKSINLPSKLEFIGEKNFNGCKLLENIIIPNSIKKIYNNTFTDCISLSSITIPNSVTSIEYSSFKNCLSLTDVYFQGTEEEWNDISISGYNEPLTNATIHYANQDNTMIFGQDNWNFTNSNMYFGMSGSKTYINPKDKYNLLSSLSNTERVRMIKYLDGTLQGSCYGMSVTELLAKVGIFDVNAWDSSADTLNELSVLDPEENSAEESLINYYQLLQVTDLIQQEISNTITNRKDYDVVAELLDMVSEVKNGGTPVLVCYSGNGFAHAVVAYGVEDDYKVINGVKYNKKILVMDSNFGNQFNSDACIYVNSDSNRWCIPYSEYNLSSDDEYTRIILATNDLELINNKGYFETPEEYLSDNQYISVLEFNYNTNFNICKTIESSNGNWINSTQNGVPEGELFYGFFANDITNTATAKTTLKDSLSGYSYSIDNPDEMDLNMSYKNCYLTINADNSYNVKFAPKGYISMEGENSSYSMNMVFNDGYYTLPWSNIQVDGKNVNNVYMDKTDDGIVISSDNLTNVKVSAISDDVFTKVTFSTEYDKALVYAIDDYTIGIKVDKDSNGTFETVLTQSKSYNKVKDFSIVGDINSDNQVSTMDLLLIKRHILGMGIDLFDIPQSDINEDSAVNLLDLLELKKYIIE